MCPIFHIADLSHLVRTIQVKDVNVGQAKALASHETLKLAFFHVCTIKLNVVNLHVFVDVNIEFAYKFTKV